MHSGTMKNGHYISICYCWQTKKWLKQDDEVVTEIPDYNLEKELVNPNASILYYRRGDLGLKHPDDLKTIRREERTQDEWEDEYLKTYNK